METNKNPNRGISTIKSSLALVAALFGLAALPAQATLINFTGGNSPTDGANGNVRTFGSISVSAQSSSTGSDPWNASYLGWYSSGLGVTNDWETGSSPSHTVDNLTGWDRVVFDFGSSVVLDKVGLTAYGDTDISVYYYTGSAWSLLESQAGGSTSRTADINAGTLAARKWAIGTGVPSGTYGTNDDFKISNVTFTAPPQTLIVPDAGGTLPLLLATVGLMFVATRVANLGWRNCFALNR